MSHLVFRKGGIPVLASVPHKPAPWLCFLVVRVDESHHKATVELQFSRKFLGSDGERRLSLVYDADNLVPGSATLDHANSPPPPYFLSQIARHNGRNLKILSLALMERCTVRWPRALGDIEHSLDERYQQLADLASATSLHILFDYAWLSPAKSAQFLSLVDTSKQLVGYPVDTVSQFREADWTVLVPEDPAPLEAPPLYRDASLRRPRQSRTSSPQAPAPKRLRLDPALETDAGSPTEKATTVATPSPKSSSPTGPFDIHTVVETAVEAAVAKLLPDTLRAVLPAILTCMLAVPTSPPPSPSKDTSPSKEAPPLPSNTLPPPPYYNPMAPLHKYLRNHLTTHADALAKQVTLDTHSHATWLRDTADLELQEQLDDQRLEFTVLKEDGLMELHRVCDAKLQALEEHAAEVVKSVERETAVAYTSAREKLDALVGEQRMGIAREIVRVEARRRRRGSLAAESAQRAHSVPLEAGW